MNNKTKKPLSEIGIPGMTGFEFDNNILKVHFELHDSDSVEFSTSFSEINLLKFVALSYGESSLTLLSVIEKIDKNDMQYLISKANRYLPAMFCFRHFVELSLKWLYMKIFRESFPQGHSIQMLYDSIKSELSLQHINSDVYVDIINYLQQIEKNDYDLRYLIDTNFVPTKTIEIDYMNLYNDVNKFISAVKIIILSAREKSSCKTGGQHE